jgi:thymidylate synthase (FAD)
MFSFGEYGMSSFIKVTYIDHMGSDLSVVNAARVSFGKKSEALGTSGVEGEPMTPILNDPDKRLIKYLAKHKHMSPFGHAFASFHVKAPIFVARQLVKHKFLRWNEISRRYVDDEPEFYVPDEWRDKSADKKQGSGGKSQSQYFPNIYVKEVADKALGDYKKMLVQGICPEQARMVLPQSTMTEWYWSGSLDAFSDMCILRCKEDTQFETRIVADEISACMKGLFPIAWGALTV